MDNYSFDSVIKVISKALSRATDKSPNVFHISNKTMLRERSYKNYDHYIQHQKEKLKKVYSDILKYDLEYEQIVRERYSDFQVWQGKTILCLAARLGGEVRAFKSLGALAIGIDIEPGNKNMHVLHGDFHNVQFPDSSFDYIFSNALDHAYDLDRLLNEAYRLLNKTGLFIVELCVKAPGNYESIDTSIANIEVLTGKLTRKFCLLDSTNLKNRTGFVQWEGIRFTLKK